VNVGPFSIKLEKEKFVNISVECMRGGYGLRGGMAFALILERSKNEKV